MNPQFEDVKQQVLKANWWKVSKKFANMFLLNTSLLLQIDLILKAAPCLG
jgi:hypothetical protein